MTKEINKVMINEHKTLKTNICMDGCSLIDLNEIEKNPHIIDEEAPAIKYLALEFNLFRCNHRNFNIHTFRQS